MPNTKKTKSKKKRKTNKVLTFRNANKRSYKMFYDVDRTPINVTNAPIKIINGAKIIKNLSKIETPPQGLKSQFLMPLGLPLGSQNAPKSTKSASGRPPECEVLTNTKFAQFLTSPNLRN